MTGLEENNCQVDVGAMQIASVPLRVGCQDMHLWLHDIISKRRRSNADPDRTCTVRGDHFARAAGLTGMSNRPVLVDSGPVAR